MIWRRLRYWYAMWLWYRSDDFHKIAGEPWLGKTRQERNRFIRIHQARVDARKPKREDYGL